MENLTKTEFYDQQKWFDLHRNADQLIATKDSKILAAVYFSPDERVRQDQSDYVEMLQNWANGLTP